MSTPPGKESICANFVTTVDRGLSLLQSRNSVWKSPFLLNSTDRKIYTIYHNGDPERVVADLLYN